MTNSEIKKCEHKQTIVVDNAVAEWCEDCGAFRIKSGNPWKWVNWYFPRPPEPTKAEKCIECSCDWHTLTYQEYCNKHGAYPRSCPMCHSCFNPKPKAENGLVPIDRLEIACMIQEIISEAHTRKKGYDMSYLINKYHQRFGTLKENGLVRLDDIKLWETINTTCSLRGITLSRGNISIIRDAILDTFGTPSITKEYKRNQPCGCVMCVCQDEKQCHGCGAKSCAKWREEGHREKLIYKDESINITKEQLLAILPEKIDKIPGKGCKCAAHGECECGCGADWTDYKTWNKYHDQMKQRIEELWKA